MSTWWSRFRESRGYRDIALILVTVLSILAYESRNDYVDAVQDERASSLLKTCRETNNRNSHGKSEVEKRINQFEQGTPERKSAEASKDFTKALLDAVVPVENCREYVAKRVGTSE